MVINLACDRLQNIIVFSKLKSFAAHTNSEYINFLVFSVSITSTLVGVAVTNVSAAKCSAPEITPDNFHQYVTILVGSDRTFSCVIQSYTPLSEGFPKWNKREPPLPSHTTKNGSCPTLPNATCSNLTLLDVSLSNGSGYYTITAENECGSDNFTVNVQIVGK